MFSFWPLSFCYNKMVTKYKLKANFEKQKVVYLSPPKKERMSKEM